MQCFTPLHEGRLNNGVEAFGTTQFQSTPLHEGRHAAEDSDRVDGQVSIHAPTRGATSPSSSRQQVSKFQSTPLHEGRLVEPTCRNSVNNVSIHAPTRGATRGPSRTAPARTSFNPRPYTRGDVSVAVALVRTVQFQSTPLHEGRRQRVRQTPGTVEVSIHAPTRGATQPVTARTEAARRFNPRPYTSGDDHTCNDKCA